MMPGWLRPLLLKFTDRLRLRSLHHALLLSGIAGTGKRVLATALAKTILCKQVSDEGSCGQCQSCLLFEAGNHPDYHQLVSEKQLGVDAVRGGIQKLAGTAQLGNNKVLVIPDADTMTEAASNALLKTLEEPTVNTYLLLLTSRKTALLPTILSRCEKHDIPLPAEQTVIDWLAAQGMTDVTPATIKAYGYAPYTVLDSLQEGAEGLSFTGYQQGIADLMGNKESPRSLAVKWQEHAVQVVKWLQSDAHEKYIRTLHSDDYRASLKCQQASAQLQHPGVNKAVILTGVLSVFSVNPL
ncbi:MAG: DNA polymerase III subunit delta' [Pseudomonadota bacterium]|nr:DNA polymerase III subunit delta' [Pseudomonadota bacterium]